MSWEAIEDYLFDRYCVEGIDRELAVLFERHDEEIRAQTVDRPTQEIIKAIQSVEMDIIHKLPDYNDGDKKGSIRKMREFMQKHEYDEDLIENINNDFCQGFDIAKRMTIDMCKNAWWLRTPKQENVIRSEKTDAYFSLNDWLQTLKSEDIVFRMHENSDLYPEAFVLLPEETGTLVLKHILNTFNNNVAYNPNNNAAYLQIEYHDDDESWSYEVVDTAGNASDISKMIKGNILNIVRESLDKEQRESKQQEEPEPEL